MTNTNQLNVFKKKLQICSIDPMTGYFRDGCCNSSKIDQAKHTLCASVTEKFLKFSLSRGNDLKTPRFEFNFPGLTPGNRWCLCIDRWIEALENECAPKVVLQATNISVLDRVDIEILKKFALDLN